MRHKRRPRYDWQLIAFIAVVAACVIGYFGYIVRYGVNVVFWDDWSWATFLVPGQPTIASLWAQHNESILFFPNVLAYFLIRVTSWNETVFFWISGVLLMGVLALITRVFWDEIKRAPLLWLPLPFIVLTLAQYQNTLWAYQMAWFIVLLCIVSALFLLERPNLSVWHLVGAALIGVVGSYSLLQGLLVWPAGLIILLSRGRSNRLRALWCAIGIAATAGYFVDYQFAESRSAPLSYILGHLSTVFQGLLLTAGSVIPSLTSRDSAISSPDITMAVGALLLVAGIAVVAHWIVQRRPDGPKAFCVALIVTSILFDLMLIPSRLVYDIYTGTASRYDTFVWPLLLGTYAYVVMSRPRGDSRWRNWGKAPQIAISLTMGAAIVVGTIVGVQQGQVSRDVRLTSVDVLANWQNARTAVAAPYLLPPCGSDPSYCALLKTLEHLLAADRMNIFGDSGTTLQRFRAEGIVPGGAAAKPLVIPPLLRTEVDASGGSRTAWDVLSTMSRSLPSFARDAPSDTRGIRRLLLSAINAGHEVTDQTIADSEWAPPVSAGFFLVPYVSTYEAWLAVLSRDRSRGTRDGVRS
jgi:hypothetical protein